MCRNVRSPRIDDQLRGTMMDNFGHPKTDLSSRIALARHREEFIDDGLATAKTGSRTSREDSSIWTSIGMSNRMAIWMAKRRLPERTTKTTLTVPVDILERLDSLAEEFEEYVSRSELVAEILDYVLENEEVLGEIFPED